MVFGSPEGARIPPTHTHNSRGFPRPLCVVFLQMIPEGLFLVERLTADAAEKRVSHLMHNPLMILEILLRLEQFMADVAKLSTLLPTQLEVVGEVPTVGVFSPTHSTLVGPDAVVPVHMPFKLVAMPESTFTDFTRVAEHLLVHQYVVSEATAVLIHLFATGVGTVKVTPPVHGLDVFLEPVVGAVFLAALCAPELGGHVTGHVTLELGGVLELLAADEAHEVVSRCRRRRGVGGVTLALERTASRRLTPLVRGRLTSV